MNKKAKIIIAALIFIFLGLIIYAFAAPKNDEETLDNKVQQVEEDKNTSKDTDKKESKEESEDKEDEGTTTNTNKESKENTPEVVVDNGYDKAKAAVEKAQGSLDAEDVKAAEEAIGNVSGQDTKELTDALDKVKSDINAKELVEELEEMVNNAASKEDMDAARAFEDEKEVKNVVANVNNEDLKEVLEGTLEELSKLLDDKDAPVIDPVDGTITNKDVTINVNDKNEVVITLGEKEIETGEIVTDEGTYTVTATDAAFNTATATFTIDKTAPYLADQKQEVPQGHHRYRLNLTFSEDVYVTEGNTTTEELSKEYTVVYNNSTVKLTLKDAAGNENVIYVKLDQNLNQPTVSYDKDKNKLNYKVTNQDVTVTIKADEEVKPVEGWTLSADRKSLSKVFEENTDGVQELTVTDLAGNAKNVTYNVDYIDKVAPQVVSVEQEKVQGKYIITVTFSEEVGKHGKYSTEQKVTYTEPVTLEFKDRAGNTNTYELVWDTKAPEAEVTYSTTDLTNEDVVVTITANEMIKPVEGWELDETRTVLTKTFSANERYTFVTITDLAGNENNLVGYKVSNIDKLNPEVTLRKTGDQKTSSLEIYDDAVWVNAKDDNLKEVTLNGEVVTLTNKGYKVTEDGNYEVIATDKAGNSTTVEFAIDSTDPEVTATYEAIETVVGKEEHGPNKGKDKIEKSVKLTINITEENLKSVEYQVVDKKVEDAKWISVELPEQEDNEYEIVVNKIVKLGKENKEEIVPDLGKKEEKQIVVRVTDTVGNVTTVNATKAELEQQPE